MEKMYLLSAVYANIIVLTLGSDIQDQNLGVQKSLPTII